MARPSITPDPIVVAVDEHILSWTDGHLSGTDRALVESAKIAALAELEVPLTIHGPEVPASLDKHEHPARIVAALLSVSPGRARVLQAPEEVLHMMQPGWEDEDPEELLTIGVASLADDDEDDLVLEETTPVASKPVTEPSN